LLQVLHRLIELEARAAEQAAEVEWQRADATGEAASAVRIPVLPDNAETREARELAASQLRRKIRRLKQQSSLHIVCAQNWELRSEQLRNAAAKLSVPVSVPVVEVQHGPMAAALAEINATMAGGAK
jgi:hypothetical protein